MRSLSGLLRRRLWAFCLLQTVLLAVALSFLFEQIETKAGSRSLSSNSDKIRQIIFHRINELREQCHACARTIASEPFMVENMEKQEVSRLEALVLPTLRWHSLSDVIIVSRDLEPLVRFRKTAKQGTQPLSASEISLLRAGAGEKEKTDVFLRGGGLSVGSFVPAYREGELIGAVGVVADLDRRFCLSLKKLTEGDLGFFLEDRCLAASSPGFGSEGKRVPGWRVKAAYHGVPGDRAGAEKAGGLVGRDRLLRVDGDPRQSWVEWRTPAGMAGAGSGLRIWLPALGVGFAASLASALFLWTALSVPLRLKENRRKRPDSEKEEFMFLRKTYQEISLSQKEQETTLKEKKQQAEEEKQRWEALVHSVPDLVISIDTLGRIVTWNPGAERLAGWSKAEVQGRHYNDKLRLHTKDGKPFTFDLSQESLSITSEEIYVRARHGKEIPVICSASSLVHAPKEPPVEPNGQAKSDENDAPAVQAPKETSVRAVCVLKDISKQKEIDRLKEDFLAMVTHDLKSPLAAILGFSDLMLNPKASHAQDANKRYVEAIQRSARNLLILVNNILESTRLEAGQLAYNMEDWNLAPLFSEVAELFKPMLDPKQLRLEAEVPRQLSVRADREKIREVLTNLVSNAIRFTPERGTIRMEGVREDSKVRVTVSDTGKGLFIVKRLLEGHKSTITVNSGPSEGTTFCFFLERAGVAAREGQLDLFAGSSRTHRDLQVPNAAPSVARGRILVVEDNRDVSNLIRIHLEQEGFSVIQAFTGREGIALAQKENVDLITLDYRLPDISGETVAARLRSGRSTRHIPLLAISGTKGVGRCDFADGEITKPVSPQELLDKVSLLLDSRDQKGEKAVIGVKSGR
ncbi:MAG: response regulator [Armatimonadetes bacterium]|nr:response regulator [Armatimonadota bacterium]